MNWEELEKDQDWSLDRTLIKPMTRDQSFRSCEKQAAMIKQLLDLLY